MIPAILLYVATAVADPRADALEAEALTAVQRQEWIAARERAEEAIALDPELFRAHFALGRALYEEGQLARAMFHLGRSRELYETRYASSLDTDWRFHSELVYQNIVVAGEIESHEYELELIDWYNARFEPDLVAEKAWPLMKLGRFDEAREAARDAMNSVDANQRSVGMNALCAVEGESGDRQASYTACLAALESERVAEEPDPTVDAYNASLAAWSSLRFADALTLAEEAKGGSAVSGANPGVLLVWYALEEGRGRDAVDAIRTMQAWYTRHPVHVRDQVRAEIDATFALLLLAAGESEYGFDVVSRALEYPDRRALTTASANTTQASHALLRDALRRSAVERAAERGANDWFFTRGARWLGTWLPSSVEWSDRAAIRDALTHPDVLVRTVQLRRNGGLDVPSWLIGDLIPIVGTGVFAVALERAAEAETEPGYAAYRTAFEAELRWWQGYNGDAVETARTALADLPAREVLLRARVAAVAADAAWGAGEREDALRWYGEALSTDAGVFRRLGLAIPAVVESAGGDVPDAVRSALARSPRIFHARDAFVLRVRSTGDNAEVCLLGPTGSTISCATEPPAPQPIDGEEPEPWTDADRVAALLDVAQRDLFTMPTGATSYDLRTLDGSTTASTAAARQQMRSLLDTIVRPPAPPPDTTPE